MKRTQLIIDIVSILFILLFVYTGLHKLVEHDVFRLQLVSHSLLKDNADLVAWAVPIAELTISALLLFSVTRIKGLWLAGGLMIAFTSYLIYMISTGSRLPCSCGGIISTLSWKQHIIVNTAFILMALTAIIFSRKNETKKRKLSMRPA